MLPNNDDFGSGAYRFELRNKNCRIFVLNGEFADFSKASPKFLLVKSGALSFPSDDFPPAKPC